jgi:hypothetical protein
VVLVANCRMASRRTCKDLRLSMLLRRCLSREGRVDGGEGRHHLLVAVRLIGMDSLSMLYLEQTVSSVHSRNNARPRPNTIICNVMMLTCRRLSSLLNCRPQWHLNGLSPVCFLRKSQHDREREKKDIYIVFFPYLTCRARCSLLVNVIRQSPKPVHWKTLFVPSRCLRLDIFLELLEARGGLDEVIISSSSSREETGEGGISDASATLGGERTRAAIC